MSKHPDRFGITLIRDEHKTTFTMTMPTETAEAFRQKVLLPLGGAITLWLATQIPIIVPQLFRMLPQATSAQPELVQPTQPLPQSQP